MLRAGLSVWGSKIRSWINQISERFRFHGSISGFATYVLRFAVMA